MNIQKIISDIADVDYELMDQKDFRQEIGILISGNEAQEFVDVYRALEMLVKAKLLKDFQGETNEYKQQKEQAWAKAFGCFNIKKFAEEQLMDLQSQMNILENRILTIKEYIK